MQFHSTRLLVGNSYLLYIRLGRNSRGSAVTIIPGRRESTTEVLEGQSSISREEAPEYKPKAHGRIQKTQRAVPKKPRLLGDKIVSGEALDLPPIWPSMASVMTAHGEMFKSASPADDQPFNTKPSRSGSPNFTIITPEEIAQAKSVWPRSAPGSDGVTVPAVLRCSNNML